MTIDVHPQVSIITVNFNSTDVTCALLESIKRVTYPNIQIIVVDNASKLDPTESLHRANERTLVIRSERNLGFAGGNNLALPQATGDFLFFVNNDTEFTPDIIDGLLEVFDKSPKTGLVSPKFRYYYDKSIIEYAGYSKINPFSGRNKMIGCKEKDAGQYDQLSETFYGHGGAMMVPKSVIERVGPMNEDYFLYYEEFDWCERIRKYGFKIFYQYKSLIYHKESATIGRVSALKTFYLNRNRIIFMKRNFKQINYSIFLTYLFLCSIPVNVFRFLIHRQFSLLKAFSKGIISGISGAKVMHA